MADESQDKVVCHECDLVSVIPELSHNQSAFCPRCGLKLTGFKDNHQQAIVAMVLTALIFFGFSIPFEFLSFSSQGLSQAISLPGSIQLLMTNEYLGLAILLALVIMILPVIALLAILYLYGCHLSGFNPPASQTIVRVIYWLLPWSMVEIFLVGVSVSLIKIVSLADVALGVSFYSYIGFTLTFVGTLVYLDKHQLKKNFRIELPHHQINHSYSVQRTWALLVTSVILYIPANTLPIMYTRTLGSDQPSTIMGGVLVLWEMGSYPIAMVIFIASVLVPLGKLVILIWLNYSVHQCVHFDNTQRIFWYRVTEFIGRWSMVDVFVVAILVSLIQLGNLMSIYPGPAAMAFCGVVIMTMLAAMTFDTRLMWNTRANE